jgi:hypothetical protein
MDTGMAMTPPREGRERAEAAAARAQGALREIAAMARSQEGHGYHEQAEAAPGALTKLWATIHAAVSDAIPAPPCPDCTGEPTDMVCEQHPESPWPHECPGPGMPEPEPSHPTRSSVLLAALDAPAARSREVAGARSKEPSDSARLSAASPAPAGAGGADCCMAAHAGAAQYPGKPWTCTCPCHDAPDPPERGETEEA